MNKYMITTDELSELLEIPEYLARKVIKEVNMELSKKGYIAINTRPLKAPRKEVFKRLGIEVK